METLRNAMGRLDQTLTGDDDRDDPLLADSDGLCSLSPLQRIYAFATFLLVGSAFLLLSLVVVYRPVKFSLLFSLGNLLAVGSTVFIIGLGQQVRMMFDPVRVYATCIYVGSIILALICALLLHNKILTVLAMIAEICALIWYSLSYVPFARRTVSQLLISCCDTEI